MRLTANGVKPNPWITTSVSDCRLASMSQTVYEIKNKARLELYTSGSRITTINTARVPLWSPPALTGTLDGQAQIVVWWLLKDVSRYIIQHFSLTFCYSLVCLARLSWLIGTCIRTLTRAIIILQTSSQIIKLYHVRNDTALLCFEYYYFQSPRIHVHLWMSTSAWSALSACGDNFLLCHGSQTFMRALLWSDAHSWTLS